LISRGRRLGGEALKYYSSYSLCADVIGGPDEHVDGSRLDDEAGVVGADNLPIATFLRPALSSIALNPVEIADRMCTAIRSRLERHAHAEPVVAGVLATPLLIRRETS
jgi:DNA-binding LacI/PurR family transcriptional regulator